MARTPPSHGFTLLELLIGVLIISVLSTIGVQSFNSIVQRTRRTTALNELLYYLYFARSEAIKRNRTVSLCPSKNQSDCIRKNTINANEWSNGWIIFEDANKNRYREKTEKLLLVHPRIYKQDQLYFKGAFSYKVLQFTPHGSTSGTGSFLYCPQNQQEYAKAIVLNLIGRARVSLPEDRQCNNNQLSDKREDSN